MHSVLWRAAWGLVGGMALCAGTLRAQETEVPTEATVSVDALPQPASYLQEPTPVDPQDATTSNAPLQAAIAADFAPRWYVGGEALFLTRDRPQTRILTVDTTPGLGRPSVLTTQSAEFDYQVGGRLTVGRELSSNQVLEIVYFGVTNINGTASVFGGDDQFATGFNTAAGGIGTTLFDNAESVRLDVKSSLHSVEFNKLRILTSTVTLVSGARYVNMADQFTYTAFNSIAIPPVANTFARYNVETENDMFGYQIGGLVNQLVGSRTTLGLKGKVGLFANIQEQQTNVERFNTGGGLIPLNSSQDHDASLATIIDLGVTGQFRLTDSIFLRGGYEMMIVGGLALAGDQLGFRQSGTVDNGGTMVAHGATVGLTWIR